MGIERRWFRYRWWINPEDGLPELETWIEADEDSTMKIGKLIELLLEARDDHGTETEVDGSVRLSVDGKQVEVITASPDMKKPRRS